MPNKKKNIGKRFEEKIGKYILKLWQKHIEDIIKHKLNNGELNIEIANLCKSKLQNEINKKGFKNICISRYVASGTHTIELGDIHFKLENCCPILGHKINPPLIIECKRRKKFSIFKKNRNKKNTEISQKLEKLEYTTEYKNFVNQLTDELKKSYNVFGYYLIGIIIVGKPYEKNPVVILPLNDFIRQNVFSKNNIDKLKTLYPFYSKSIETIYRYLTENSADLIIFDFKEFFSKVFVPKL